LNKWGVFETDTVLTNFDSRTNGTSQGGCYVSLGGDMYILGGGGTSQLNAISRVEGCILNELSMTLPDLSDAQGNFFVFLDNS
jgi:hypothetical protein